MRPLSLRAALLASVLCLAWASRSEAGLVAYYPMDDPGNPATLLDTVGGNNGTVQGAVYTGAGGGHTGQPGDYAMDFSSGDVVVAGGGFAGNAVANNAITFSFWQKAGYSPGSPPASSSFWAVSPSAGGGQRGAQAHVPWSNRTIYWDTAGCCGGNTRLTASGADISDDNDWHHFAFVKSGTHKEIWVDGSRMASHDGATAPLLPFSQLLIGRGAGGGGTYQGLIDDLAIWDRALSDSEIGQLAAGIAAPTAFAGPTPDPGWVGRPVGAGGGHFDYDAGTGTLTVTADGQDIWGTYDRFYFLLPEDPANPGEPLKTSGDFIARARVVDMTEGVWPWQKSGLMARADLDGNSVHVMTVATEGNGIVQQWRDSKGGASGWPGTRLPGSPNNADGVANWVLLSRSGDTFISNWAPDAGGAPGNWGPPRSHTSPNMPDEVYLGLTMTAQSQVSHQTATTVFDNVEVVPALSLGVMGQSSGGSTWHFTADPNFVDDPSGLVAPVAVGGGTSSASAAVPASLATSPFYVTIEATDTSATPSFAGALVSPPGYVFDANGNGAQDTGETQYFTTHGQPFAAGEPLWAGSASLVSPNFFPGSAAEVETVGYPFPEGTEAIWYGTIGGTVYLAARVPPIVQGTWAPPPTPPPPPPAGVEENASRRMTAGDFDNDGVNEVAFIHTSGRIFVQDLNDPASSGLVTTERASALTAADIDGNGTPEIAFVNAATGQLQSYSAATDAVSTLPLPAGVPAVLTVSAGDLDGEEGEELIVLSRTGAALSGTPYVRAIDGTWSSPGGALAKVTAEPVMPGNPNDVLLGRNMNPASGWYHTGTGWVHIGGGRLDQITAGNYFTSDSEAEPYINTRDEALWVYNAGAWRNSPGRGQAVAAGRIDEDLPLERDLFYVIGTNDAIYQSRLDWSETGAGGYTYLLRDASSSPASPNVWRNGRWRDLLISDVDDDGLDELIVRSANDPNRLYIFNNGQSAFAPLPRPSRPGPLPTNPVQDAGLKLWLDASTISGLDTGDPVATWPDRSGNGNDATASGAKQPTYLANSTLADLPVVRFDGTDDGMATPLNISSGGYTVFAVFNYDDGTSAFRRAVQGSNNWLIGPYNNEIRHYAGGWVSTGTGLTPTRFYIAEATNDGAGSLFRVDGVNRTTSSGPTGHPGTIHLAGSGLYPNEILNGEIAEVLVYDRPLTNRERNRVGMYLQEKYGLEAGYNLALNESIIDGSSAYNGQPFNSGSFPAYRVVDGRLDETFGQTYWLGSNGDPTEYFTLDLGVRTNIQTIALRNTHNGGNNDRGTRDFQLWAANKVDAANQLVNPVLILEGKLTTSIGPNGDMLIPLDIFNSANGLRPGAYRYLRFNTLSSSFGNNHVGLNEIQVFDEMLSANLAPGATVIKRSGEYDNRFVVENAIDQRIDDEAGGGITYWLGRNYTMDEYFILDLGEVYTIDRIELQNTHNRGYNDRGTADFEIWASLGVDANNELLDPRLILDSMLMDRCAYGYNIPFDVFSAPNGDFPPFNARYLKFVANTYWGVGSGLSEIRIFGYVPEPTTSLLLAAGLVLLARRRRSGRT